MSNTTLQEWLGRLGLTKEPTSIDILSGSAVNNVLSKIIPNYTVRLSPNTTPSARINNWNIVISELDKLGIHVGQQEKTRVLNSDQKAVYAILQELKHYYQKHKEETDMDLSKIDARGDPKTARSLLQLLILVIIKYYGFSVKQAVALLSNDSKYLAHILAKGFKQKSKPVEMMMVQLMQLLPQVSTFCRVKENEIFFLKSIKPGLISKFLSISQLALQLLTAFIRGGNDRYQVVKNELMATFILCIRRHSCMIPAIINSLSEMIGHNKNLLPLLLSHASPAQVQMLMIEMVSQCEIDNRLSEVFEQFKMQEFMQLCIENLKNTDLFINAATLLIKVIEHNYFQFAADAENLSKLVDSLSAISISKRGDVMVFANLLFTFLQQFGKKKNAVAAQLLNIAVDRYKSTINEDESSNYLHNFLQIVEYFPSVPTAPIADAILARFQSSTTPIRQLQFDFFVGCIDGIPQKVALRMLSSITKIFVEELGWKDYISRIVIAIIRKFQSSKPLFDMTVKFIKVCLSVHYANLRKLTYSKSLVDGNIKIDKANAFFKAKNIQVQVILTNVLTASANNQKLSISLQPLICYSFFQSQMKSKEESEGIRKVMLMLGTEDQLRKLYETQAKMMLEDPKQEGRKKGDKEKDKNKEKGEQKARVNSDVSLLSKKKDLFSTLNPPRIPLDVQKGLEKYSHNFLEKVGKLSLEEEKKAQDEERREELRRRMALKMVEKGININMGKEVAVGCLYEFNSREKQLGGSDYSYLPFYDEEAEEQRDIKGLQYLLKRYAKLFKLYYTNYGRLRPNNIKLFDDISERGGLMQSANAWKLLRDHQLDQYITINEVQYLVQRINAHFKKQYRDSSLLDYQAFENFIIQAALTMFSKPPKDMRSRPLSEMVQEIVNRFREHAQEYRIDEKLFEENQNLQTAKPEELKDLNEKLKENPDYILPEGYKKQTTKKVAFVYKLNLNALDSAYSNVSEVLDQIFHERLGFHIIEPNSVTYVQAVAKPILYQTQNESTIKQRSLSSIFPRESHFAKEGELEGSRGKVENKFSKEKRLKLEQKQLKEAEEAKRREERDREIKAMLEKHRGRQLEIDRKKEEQRNEELRKAEEERKRKEKYEEQLKRKLSEYAEKKKLDRTKEEEEARRKKEDEARNMQKMKAEIERKRKMIEDAKQKKREQQNARIQKEAAGIKKREEENKIKLLERKEKTIKMLQDYRYKKQKEREDSDEKLKQSQQSLVNVLIKPNRQQTPNKLTHQQTPNKLNRQQTPSKLKIKSSRAPSSKKSIAPKQPSPVDQAQQPAPSIQQPLLYSQAKPVKMETSP